MTYFARRNLLVICPRCTLSRRLMSIFRTPELPLISLNAPGLPPPPASPPPIKPPPAAPTTLLLNNFLTDLIRERNLDDDTRMVRLSAERARRRNCTLPFFVQDDNVVEIHENTFRQRVRELLVYQSTRSAKIPEKDLARGQGREKGK